MAARSDRSLAALLLTQRLVETSVAPLKASEYWSVLERVGDPGTLLTADPASVARAAGIESELADRLAQRLDAATSFAFQLDEAQQSGLRVVSSVDDDYPTLLVDRLGRGAPPLLYLVGEPSLLGRDFLGVVGSREVTEPAAEVARQAATEAVSHGLGVVSGAAKGVDRLAMSAALGAGGHAVGILADSLTQAVRDAEIRHMVGEGQLCLCTPYRPTAGFSVANAMGRNKLIYALSQATLVVSADLEKGGTWAGAVEALKGNLTPLLVWTGEGAGEGNASLSSLGGTDVASISELFPLPKATASVRSPTDQLALDV
jgi:predicted Rossmann fold nucleotide-binding protein DprA/Smf involved in DNA uptake